MKFIFGVMTFLLGVGGVAYMISQQPIPHDAIYTGSLQCNSCHMNEHKDWRSSLHPKMMRKVFQESVVVADLQSESIAFNPEKAVWAIGSKWEQQFMGEENGVETLLPGAWLVHSKVWQVTGWDGWQVPEPIKRCHGCHTVGLNTETGSFVEPGVGCESCHGPGSWHVNTAGLGKIVSGLDAQLCGQCHSRGRTPDGIFFFPVGYKPGHQLLDYFKEDEPDYIQNSTKWWGNGHPRKRHQEYYAWKQGGHVNSLKSLTENYSGQYGEVNGRCLSCHAGEAIMDNQSASYSLNEVGHGITCAVCHNVHDDLDRPRISCANCHGEGAFYHQPNLNKNHIPCPNEAQVECQQCHMPLTTKMGGDYALHSHRAGIIPPADTEKFSVPNSCGNGVCHESEGLDWQKEQYQNHYLDLK